MTRAVARKSVILMECSRTQTRSVAKKTRDEIRFGVKYGMELPDDARSQPEGEKLLACEKAVADFSQNPCQETLECIHELRDCLPFISSPAYEALMASKFLEVVNELLRGEPPAMNHVLELITASLSSTSPFLCAYRSIELVSVLEDRLNNLAWLGSDKESQMACLMCLNRMCAIGTKEVIDQLNHDRLFATLLRVTSPAVDVEVMNLGLATLSMAVTFPNVNGQRISQLQGLSNSLLLSDHLEYDQMCAAANLFNRVVEKLGAQLKYYNQPQLLMRILALINTSEGLLRTSLLKTLTLLTRDATIVDRLLELEMLEMIMAVAKTGTDHSIILNIASNVACMSVDDCEKVVESGYVELAVEAFESGSFEDKVDACYLVSNILWKGTHREIEQVTNPRMMGFLFDFLTCDDMKIVQIVLDGFQKGLDSERECGATALHEMISEQEIVESLTTLANSTCEDVSEVANLLLQELGVAKESL